MSVSPHKCLPLVPRAHSHAAVEVHAVDTNAGVVLDTKIDVLADTEAEVAGLGEVALAELVLLDLETTLQDLLGLGATDGDVDSNLFVTTDTEGTDGVTGLAYKSKKNLPSATQFHLKNLEFFFDREKNFSRIQASLL